MKTRLAPPYEPSGMAILKQNLNEQFFKKDLNQFSKSPKEGLQNTQLRQNGPISDPYPNLL